MVHRSIQFPMKIKLTLPGILFLVGYEAFFLSLLLLSISSLDETHEAWLNYKRDASPADYDGYLDYQAATFWTCLCSMMIAWPPAIFVVGWCCGHDDNDDNPKTLHTILLEPETLEKVESEPACEKVVVTTVTV